MHLELLRDQIISSREFQVHEKSFPHFSQIEFAPTSSDSQILASSYGAQHVLFFPSLLTMSAGRDPFQPRSGDRWKR